MYLGRGRLAPDSGAIKMTSPRRAGRSTSRRAQALAALVLATLVCLIGQPAGAAGNRALDRDIIADPIPGWQSLPAAQVNETASRIQSVESASLVGSGVTTATAAEEWRDPSSSSTFVLVILIGLSSDKKSDTAEVQHAAAAAGTAAVSFCAGASGASPISDRPLLSIPTSRQAVCADKALNGTSLAVVAWGKANILAVVAASTGLTRLDAVALREYQAMPVTGSTLTSAAGDSSTAVIIAVVAVIVVMAVVLALVVTTRRRRIALSTGSVYGPHVFPAGAYPSGVPGAPPTAAPPSGPPAGWYPAPDVPGGTRYWTGRDWGPVLAPPTDDPVDAGGPVLAPPTDDPVDAGGAVLAPPTDDPVAAGDLGPEPSPGDGSS
jgi:hypothetical protein